MLTPICERLPAQMQTYYEPFAGSAAVFFRLAAEGRFKKAVISDKNPELVQLYRTVQKDVEGLITALKTLTHSKDDYYAIRAWKPTELEPSLRAARLIYLNRAGYNGLYRVNRSGQFNVPFGSYKNPKICDEDRLRSAAKALKKAKILHADFEKAIEGAEAGDAIYFDPPYVPMSKTASFTAYHSDPFLELEQNRLGVLLKSLAKKKIPFLLSNSDTAETRELYQGHLIESIQVSRPINSRATGRGAVSELLVQAKPSKKRG